MLVAITTSELSTMAYLTRSQTKLRIIFHQEVVLRVAGSRCGVAMSGGAAAGPSSRSLPSRRYIKCQSFYDNALQVGNPTSAMSQANFRPPRGVEYPRAEVVSSIIVRESVITKHLQEPSFLGLPISIGN